MWMSLFIEEYSRLVTLHSTHWERAPSPRQILPVVSSEVNSHAFVLPMRSRQDELLIYTNGGEEQYSAPSQTSSDISLTTSAPGRLPSSADTMVRAFWSELDQDPGDRRQNDE
ncbi:hypothetical protein GGR53DRAFT_465522 [Hypoxylon sp. FL1150]|nr:hypothetical protein GGR53DRAFT_465522 [Hypoxylon sp. FL1150]